MKSTVVKPSNGRSASPKARPPKNRPWSVGLRRLSKRQKEKIYRVVVTVFLIIFTVSIVGGIIALTVLAPSK